jgi:hypothetical protein
VTITDEPTTDTEEPHEPTPSARQLREEHWRTRAEEVGLTLDDVVAKAHELDGGRHAKQINQLDMTPALYMDLHMWLSTHRLVEPYVYTPDDFLHDAFWSARPVLQHIRQAAHARQRSAPAVLHVVLARVAAAIPHVIELPPIVGSAAPLCYSVVLLAASGVGKSSASNVGTELLPLNSNFLDPRDNPIADGLPLGSGEGLVEVLFDFVDDENGKKVKRQVRQNAYVMVDEGQVLTDLGKRTGSTLLPVIRTIWTGGTIGNTNASQERKRIVPAGQYTVGIVVALQDLRAGALLDDADAGTPQRFAWARATDPSIPDVAPEWPGPLEWGPPSAADLDLEPNAQGYRRARMTVDDSIATELRAADLDRARGQTVDDALDAHAGLLTLKIAGLLAILDGRLHINFDDWDLAKSIKWASDAVRSEVVTIASQEETRRNEAAGRMLGHRQHVAAETVETRRLTSIVDVARKIAEKVWSEKESTVSEIRRKLSTAQRPVFDDALEHAKGEDWIVEDEEPGQRGGAKRVLRPGDRKPT